MPIVNDDQIDSTLDKQKRLKAANDFLAVIASCGRHFFKHIAHGEEFVSTFELSDRGQVYFIDYYTKKRINTAKPPAEWSGFTSGGTLKDLVRSLSHFILNGHTLNAWYFSEGNSWGYGVDICDVCQAAIALGVAEYKEI